MAQRSADFLGCLFGISMLCHGMFFLREWLIIGLMSFAGAGWLLWHKEKGQLKVNEHYREACRTTGKKIWFLPFLGMAAISLFGLLRPVIAYLAWFEMWRWLFYACIFWWSRELVQQGQFLRLRAWMLAWGVLLVVSGFVPGLTSIWPQAAAEAYRWSSWIGYPNMAGAMAGGLFFLALPAGRKETEGFFRYIMLKSLMPLVFLAALWASGSRGVLVCWLAVMIVWVCLKDKRCEMLLFALLAVLAGVTGVFLAKILWGLDGEWTRLLIWNENSLAERIYYLRDALKLTALNSFWPSAGGWHAYPLVADQVYYSSDPHSAILSILLNQGVLGLLFVLLCGVNSLRLIVSRKERSLHFCRQNRPIIAGLCFLALHSLMDADMAFGCAGLVFWIFAGAVSFSAPSE